MSSENVSRAPDPPEFDEEEELQPIPEGYYPDPAPRRSVWETVRRWALPVSLCVTAVSVSCLAFGTDAVVAFLREYWPVALAPFDLGVSQSFSLRSTPSEIPGIDEVRVIMRRLSGQPRDWARMNKVFLDDLRKQFLIWRSIPRETMEHYRRITLNSAQSRPGGQAGAEERNS